jgi:hypothetical protein
VHLSTHVSNAHVHVSKALNVRAVMALQDVRSGSVVNACKACGQATTLRHQCSVNAIDHSPSTATVPSDSQHDVTLLIECSVIGDETRRAHTVENIICYF